MLKSHSRHLQGLLLKTKALTGQMLTETGVMAFSHHELSVENVVIPFSSNPPKRSSRAGPATFEMEHSYR
ncbi:hypothetical protein B723_04060 [Pseudomonas fluorescens NCIMB 11764]|uniref:Uncharacterized protein n=1 Tax=Pseudomonas fluorescens NCIMB 11764 TaxID=1221522 RepID=A0A0K1QIS4_PSEFL|nr:hypothetical protein B723_04060 [Pseudomonas fluorescens NCIMB 11764]